MSAEHIDTRPRDFEQLEQYPPAVLYVMAARLEQGNQTVYDRFLCDYIGEVTSPQPSPLTLDGPSGARYSYNNPLTTHRSFTAQGTLLTVRHAEQTMAPGDESCEFFVASANLETSRITHWCTERVDWQNGSGGQQVTVLLSDRPQLRVVQDADPTNPFAWSLQHRKARQAAVRAVLTMNSRGLQFMDGTSDRGLEQLEDIRQLVADVNALTDYYQISLVRSC